MNKFLSSIVLLAALSSSAFALSVSDITDITPKVDEAPVPVKTPPPEYPDALRKEGVSGMAVVTVVIDENGEVLAAESNKASHEGFKQPAVDAVKGWKFKPAKVGGKAVKVKVSVPIKFNNA